MNAKSGVLSSNKIFNTLKFSKTIEADSSRIHKTAPVRYPSARTIPLPRNVEAIVSNEIGRFSPQRVRDLNGPVIISQSAHKAVPVFLIQRTETSFDPRVACFDGRSAVSLNSSMQTNVPHPFSSKGKATHLNMPGGQWERTNKFVAEDLQRSHYLNWMNKKKKEVLGTPLGIREYCTLSRHLTQHLVFLSRFESTKTNNNKSAGDTGLTRAQKLKQAVKEYGTTVVVFHVGISLVSLGICYALVSSGVDVTKALTLVGIECNKMAANTGTFVAAYAVHKILAPVRISITLGATPFIVKYLRKIGILKHPKGQQ